MSRPSPELMASLLRQDFDSFLRKSFYTLSPGQVFEPGWPLRALTHRLQQVRSGELRRLVINMPPRSLKSLTTSVAFPAYLLGHDPSRRTICVSYSSELAYKHSNDFRALISAPWYQRAFPNTRVGRFKDSEGEIEFTGRGYRLATSVNGTLTGRGGDLIIIDDPLKPIDSLSEPKRSAVNNWFTSTLMSRLDDKRTGAIVVVMQRVHMDDLTGFVLGQSDDWVHLNLPAIAERDEDIPLGPTEVYHRRAGEALFPEREPLGVLEGLRATLGSDLFSAQYQQAPVPPGGAMIKRHWVRRYTELPPEHQRLMIMQSWDTAGKGGPDNDWSVCTTWQQTRDCQWYLLDVWRGRVDYPALKAQVAAHATKWRARKVLIEESGTAMGLLQELRYVISGGIGIKPDRDKATRMSMASATFEAGQVHFPVQASWLATLEAELFAFPGSAHDDQVDSISQAILHGKSNLWIWAKLV